MSEEDVAVDQPETGAEPMADPPDEASDSGTEDELSDDERFEARLKETVGVESEEIGSLRLKLTVTVPQETLAERQSEQFAELQRDALVPGFRKGRAPRALVEKRFAHDVSEQLKSQVFSKAYLAAVDKAELDVLGDPLFWVKVPEERTDEAQKPHMVDTERLLPVDQALEHLALPKEGSLHFSCEVELKPEFELPELKAIPLERPDLHVEDEDVEAELRRMRLWRSTFKPVESGPIEADDMVYADVVLRVDGEIIQREENCDMAARDMRLMGVQLTGLGDALTGRTVADTVTIEAVVPDDHENIDIRGKTGKFDFTIREVKRLHMPPIDDSFLSTMGFESETELRDALRSRFESSLSSTVNENLREQIGHYLVKNTKLDIPEGLSQRQTDRSLARRRLQMQRDGLPEAEVEKNMDALQPQAHDRAVEDLKLFFILTKIAEQREIEVSEEQINGAIAEIAQRTNRRFDRCRDELSKGDGLAVLYHQLRDRQVLDGLLADAAITETKRPKKPAPHKTTTEGSAKSTPTAGKTATAKKTAVGPKKTAAKATTKRSSAGGSKPATATAKKKPAAAPKKKTATAAKKASPKKKSSKKTGKASR